MSHLLNKLQTKLDSYTCTAYTAIAYQVAIEYPTWCEERVCGKASKIHNRLWQADEDSRKVLRIAIKRELEDIAIREAMELINGI